MTEMTCIECPNGCRLRVEQNAEGGYTVTGGRCRRGQAFAIAEMTAPMRTIATTVKTDDPSVPVLPVRVSGPIPKERIFDVMASINRVCAKRPVQRGGVIIKNVLGLNVDIIAESGILSGEDDQDE